MAKYKWLEYRGFDEETYDALEDLPAGWYKAFGEQMVDELNDLLIKYNYVDEYCIIQIKEKFGGLRWYDNGFPGEGWEEYSAWSNKYADLSEETCIVCGAPGKMRMGGWICPYCDEHSNGRMSYEEYHAKMEAEKEAKQKIENDLN